MAVLFAVLVWILKAIVVVLAVLLIILALPIHYGISASYHQGDASLNWNLSWGGIPLDRFIKGRVKASPPQGKAPAPRAHVSRGNRESKETTIREKMPSPATPPQRVPKPPAPVSSVAAHKPAIPDAKENVAEQAEPTLQEKAGIIWQKRQWLLAWLQRFWGTLHLTPLYLGGEFGLADPFQTSQFYRYIILLNTFVPRGLNINLQPVYQESVISLNLRLKGWASPLQILLLALLLLLDPQTRMLIKLFS